MANGRRTRLKIGGREPVGVRISLPGPATPCRGSDRDVRAVSAGRSSWWQLVALILRAWPGDRRAGGAGGHPRRRGRDSLAPPRQDRFVGSHGIRKTTAAYAFAHTIQRAGRSVEFAREVVRDNPLGINESATGEAQLWVLVSQVRRELELAPKAEVLVTDRGVVDNYAYYLRACGGVDRFSAEPLVRAWGATYDLVVRLTPDIELRADGIRSTATRSATRSRRSSTTSCRASSVRTGWSPSRPPRSATRSTGGRSPSASRRRSGTAAGGGVERPPAGRGARRAPAGMPPVASGGLQLTSTARLAWTPATAGRTGRPVAPLSSPADRP